MVIIATSFIVIYQSVLDLCAEEVDFILPNFWIERWRYSEGSDWLTSIFVQVFNTEVRPKVI